MTLREQVAAAITHSSGFLLYDDPLEIADLAIEVIAPKDRADALEEIISEIEDMPGIQYGCYSLVIEHIRALSDQEPAPVSVEQAARVLANDPDFLRKVGAYLGGRKEAMKWFWSPANVADALRAITGDTT